MQKPWPKQRSISERASMRGTPKRSRAMVTLASSPFTASEPRVFGSGWRKRRCQTPNDAAPAEARAAAPVRLTRPATARFSQNATRRLKRWSGGEVEPAPASTRRELHGKEVEAGRAVRDVARARA